MILDDHADSIDSRNYYLSVVPSCLLIAHENANRTNWCVACTSTKNPFSLSLSLTRAMGALLLYIWMEKKTRRKAIETVCTHRLGTNDGINDPPQAQIVINILSFPFGACTFIFFARSQANETKRKKCLFVFAPSIVQVDAVVVVVVGARSFGADNNSPSAALDLMQRGRYRICGP